MKSILRLAVLILFCSNLAAGAQEIPKTDVFGSWQTHSEGIVEFKPCGTSVCGYLEWATEFATSDTPLLDEKNPDETLRSRELRGLKMFFDFEETKAGWRKGTFYDPWAGKSYPAKLTRVSSDELKVSGCVARILCRSFTWSKVDNSTQSGVPEG